MLADRYGRDDLTGIKIETLVKIVVGTSISQFSTESFSYFNPLNAKLNSICHLLALLGVHHILHISRIRVKPIFYIKINILHEYMRGARGGVVVKALRYKRAGRGFDSRWCHWNFSVT